MRTRFITAAAAAIGLMTLGCAATERLEPVPLTSGVLLDYEPINILGAPAPATLEGATGATRRSLRAALHAARPDFERCFSEARVRDPLTPGAFDVWMRVTTDGTPSQLTLDSALEHPESRTCFLGLLTDLTLPAPADGPIDLGLRLRMDYAERPDVTTFDLDPLTLDATPPRAPQWVPANALQGLTLLTGELTPGADEALIERWEAYDTALQKTYEGVAACYDEASDANPDLRGRVTATFKMRANGAIDTVAFDTNSTGSPALTACIRRAAVGWAFGLPPRPGAQVSMSWLFEASSNAPLAAPAETTPEVRGALSRELVTSTLREHHGALRACYRRALIERPEIAGEATIQLWIHGESGAVTDARVIEQSGLPEDSIVAECAALRLEDAVFPGGPGLIWTRVTLPITFSLR